MTLAELALLSCKYLNSLHFSENASTHTLRAYRTDLSQSFELQQLGRWNISNSGRHEFQFFNGGQEFPPITQENLLTLCRQAMGRWSDLSAASRQRKISCLKSFLGWLFDQELIDQDLASQLPLTKVPKKLPHFISIDEVLSLLNALDQALEQSASTEKHIHIMREKVLILLLYGGGLRVSEACALRWKDSRSHLGQWLIHGKGGKYRHVSLPEIARRSLAELPREGEYIFGEKPMNTQTAYNAVRNWGRRAGLVKPLHPHALRHSYATHMLKSGTNLRTLQSLLGHSSLAATEKYLHLGVDELARTLDRHHPLAKRKN